MQDFNYLAETEEFIFYRNENGEELTMSRKSDPNGETFGVSEFVENAILEAIQNNELLKIDPSFAYDYLEIKKQVEEEEDYPGGRSENPPS